MDIIGAVGKREGREKNPWICVKLNWDAQMGKGEAARRARKKTPQKKGTSASISHAKPHPGQGKRSSPMLREILLLHPRKT